MYSPRTAAISGVCTRRLVLALMAGWQSRASATNPRAVATKANCRWLDVRRLEISQDALFTGQIAGTMDAVLFEDFSKCAGRADRAGEADEFADLKFEI